MTATVDDLKYLQYGAEELKSYLFSDDLFWPVMVNPEKKAGEYPRMTLGNILLTMQRLEALSLGRKLSDEDGSDYQRAKHAIEAVQNSWTGAWETKAAHEYRSRHRQWAEVLNELHQDKAKNAPYYSSDVRLRVLLALLDSHVPADEKPAIEPFDSVLRAIFDTGEFIWDDKYKPGFPPDTFWFLYGSIRTE